MPEPANTLLIEGSFEELAEELAQYLAQLKKPAAEDGSSVHADVVRLLEQNQKDEVLKKLVTASVLLTAAPEREFIQTYNLLIHLVRQSPNLNMFLPRICQNLSQPVTSSPQNGPAMVLTVLSTIFNILQPDNDVRYHVFLAIISVVKSNGMYEALRPQLKNVDRWIAEWESDEAEQQKLFLEIAMVAEDAGETEESYHYLVRALHTFPASESSSAQARKLALRALKSALLHPSHFDFQDLTTLDAIQALRKSDPIWFELLEIFHGKLLDDFDDFRNEHDSDDEDDDDEHEDDDDDNENNATNGAKKDKKTWLEQQGLDEDALFRKMRLLTLASLAASSSSRSLPYSTIARALQIPSADVEMWVIDVIRAGLVEGKLSQLNQTFLIHRATHRLFTEKQWRQVAARLDTWRSSLENVLKILKTEREHVEAAKVREGREMEGRMNGVGGGGGGGGGGREGGRGRGGGGMGRGDGTGRGDGGGGGGGGGPGGPGAGRRNSNMVLAAADGLD